MGDKERRGPGRPRKEGGRNEPLRVRVPPAVEAAARAKANRMGEPFPDVVERLLVQYVNEETEVIHTLATSDTELVDWLTGSGFAVRFGGTPIAERTDGGVEILRMDLLRTLADDEDGSITEGPEGPVMWVEGNPHPLTPKA